MRILRYLLILAGAPLLWSAASIACAQNAETPPELRILMHTNISSSWREGTQTWAYADGQRIGGGTIASSSGLRYHRYYGGLNTESSTYRTHESGGGGGGWDYSNASSSSIGWVGPCPADATQWSYWTNYSWWTGVDQATTTQHLASAVLTNYVWEPSESRAARSGENMPWTLIFQGGDAHQGYFERWTRTNWVETVLELSAGGVPDSNNGVALELYVWVYDNLRGRYLTWNEFTVTVGTPAVSNTFVVLGQGAASGGTVDLAPDTNANVFIAMQDNQCTEVRFNFSPTNDLPAGTPMGHYDYTFGAVPTRHQVMFYARPGLLDQGYDPRPEHPNEPHWTSLAVGGTNEITELRLPAWWTSLLGPVHLTTTGAITVSPTNNITNATTSLTITSTGAVGSTATIEARRAGDSSVLATLQVQILPLRLVPIAILRVTDPDSPGTALGATDPNGTIVDHLNRAFRQAQVQFYDNTWALFGGAYVDGVPLSYDVQPKDGILQTTNQAELNVVRNWVSTIGTNVLPIILMRQESGGYPNPLLPAALRPYRGRTLQEPDWSAVYTEPSRNILSPVAAHEVGHFLNLDHWPNELAIPGHPFPWDSGVQIEHVMRLGTPWPSRTSTNLSLPESWSVPQPGTWLNWESWTNANFQAKKKFP